MKVASLAHYWSEDYILKQFKKEKITQFHITKELVGIVRSFLDKNSYNLYCRFYEEHSGNDDCEYIEKEVKTARHTTVVAFGHAWAFCDD
jgi:fibronectin type 3 domain-containing protein